MFYHDDRLQYEVRVEEPNPLFARMLQQAIGGVEGEIRVAMQYMFQSFGMRGSDRYRRLLMETATEELGHIQMLATAVALNLEGAPNSFQEEVAGQNPMVEAILGGMQARHVLSTGLAALPTNADGVPFDASHVYASGNVAADMLANVTAESTGRTLATRLYHMTDDPGMKDMLSFLIARDTMHQNQWLAVLEELGDVHPIPNSFPQELENQEFNYAFLSFLEDETAEPPQGRWSQGESFDGRGEFTTRRMEPVGGPPDLAPPPPDSGAQEEQIEGEVDATPGGDEAQYD